MSTLRTGEQYLAMLRTRRARVVYRGEVVDDVTTHPGFRRTAQSIARFFDAHHDPALKDVLTYEENGNRYPISFLVPRSKEDLRRRTAGFTAWAELTHGMMGRSPDYMNSIISSIPAVRDGLHRLDATLGDRVTRMYERCRDENLVLTHTFVNAFKQHGDRARTGLTIEKRDASGVWVSGQRGIATLAPFADANLNISDGDTDPQRATALSFLNDVSSDGMSWVCRDSYDAERSLFDAPLSSRYEEIDSVAVWKSSFIPWERIFVFAEGENRPQLLAVLPQLQDMVRLHMLHHAIARQIAKTRFIIALAHLAIESSNAKQHAPVRTKVGSLVLVLRVLEAFLVAAIEGAQPEASSGVWLPASQPLLAAQSYFSEMHPKMLHTLRDLAGSRTISTPDAATMERYGELLEPTTRSDVGLFRTVGEVCASSWGARQDVYEMFWFGVPDSGRARLYEQYGRIGDDVRDVHRLLSES